MSSPSHEIHSPHCDPIVTISLEAEQAFRVEPGAMVAMTPNLELSSTAPGGLISLVLSPEQRSRSRFSTLYTARGGPGKLTLAPSSHGDIFVTELTQHSLMVQSLCFLGADASVAVDEEVPNGASFFGEGNDRYLVQVSGSGKVLLASCGGYYLIPLAEGESYVVDTGHVMAFQSHLRFEVFQAASQAWLRMVSEEGLVARFEGPGEVLIQTRNLALLAEHLRPLMRG